MTKVNIDLFSGMGNWSRGIQIAADLFKFPASLYLPNVVVEIDDFAHSFSPDIPVLRLTDIRKVSYISPAKMVYCSFPCRGTSMAGKRLGLQDEQSSLFYHALRFVSDCKPEYFIVENPEGFIHNGLCEAVAALEAHGYISTVILLSARVFNLPHQRTRVFLIANRNDLSPFFYRQTWWSDEVRDCVDTVRAYTIAEQIKRGFASENDGYILPERYLEIAQCPTFPDRVKMISMIGLSVVPACVAALVGFIHLHLES